MIILSGAMDLSLKLRAESLWLRAIGLVVDMPGYHGQTIEVPPRSSERSAPRLGAFDLRTVFDVDRNCEIGDLGK